ncbi:MAG: DUF423 domain-containing protein [Clostridia bacterium]|nr:DUF423 domain-containing protein [Deltaproteobacteria bacterium]
MGFIRIAAVFGFLGVALGAFGAHALKQRLTTEMLAIFQTGVLYHFIHALALLAVGILIAVRGGSQAYDLAGWAFVIGILIFSGSLYALAATGVRVLGAITPLGGIAFLVGWIALAWTTR